MGINLFNNDNELKIQQQRIPYSISKKETCKFIPPIKEGRVYQIYDANTIKIAAKIPEISNQIYRFTIDLKNIKVYSTRSKNKIQKQKAIQTKKYLSSLILNEMVFIKDLDLINNRLVANIYLGDILINDWLVKMGYTNNINSHNFLDTNILLKHQ